MKTIATARGLLTSGIRAAAIEITATATRGTGTFSIESPQTDAQKREVRVRVLSSLAALSIYGLDGHNVVVSYELGAVRASTTALDLPIAVAVLRAIGRSPRKTWDDFAFAGELSLTGELNAIRGVSVLLDNPSPITVVPRQNAAEAGLYVGTARLAQSLGEVMRFLLGEAELDPPFKTELARADDESNALGSNWLPESALRALEIAVTGRHNILFIGPYGAGKTVLARALSELLPAPEADELLTITKVHSVAGIVPDRGFVSRRPFRAPHHTVSEQGVFGGGSYSRPGEVSLAHGGVLFLDEVLEFRASLIEGLRRLGAGDLSSPAGQAARYPAGPLLCAAAPQCLCQRAPCTCPDTRLGWHRGRLRALSDLFDLSVRVPVAVFGSGAPSTPDALGAIRERVTRARAFGVGLSTFAAGTESIRNPVLAKVARTIANLDGSVQIRKKHLDEAATFRTFA